VTLLRVAQCDCVNTVFCKSIRTTGISGERITLSINEGLELLAAAIRIHAAVITPVSNVLVTLLKTKFLY
jgi:hypothetical protein